MCLGIGKAMGGRFIRLKALHNSRDIPVFHLLEISVPVLMGIFIFFNPFPHTTSIKEISFYLGSCIALVLALSKRMHFTVELPMTMPLVLFAVWALIGIFTALDQDNSIHDFRSHLLRYMVFFYLMANFYTSRKGLAAISWVVIISSAIASLVGLGFFYGTLNHDLGDRFGNTPKFSEIPTNQIGLLTVFAIILCLHHFRGALGFWRKMGFIALACPPAVATFMTQTRSAMVAIFLAILVLLSQQKKLLVMFLFLFLLLVTVLPVGNRFFAGGGAGVRLRQYQLTLEVLKDYPIMGIGFGMKRYDSLLDLNTYKKKLPEKWQNKKFLGIPHAMLTNIAVRTGLVGLGLFLWVVFVVIRTCWMNMKYGIDPFIRDWARCVFSALVGFLAIGLFEPVFFHAGEVVLYTIFAMATILWRLDREDP